MLQSAMMFETLQQLNAQLAAHSANVELPPCCRLLCMGTEITKSQFRIEKLKAEAQIASTLLAIAGQELPSGSPVAGTNACCQI